MRTLILATAAAAGLLAASAAGAAAAPPAAADFVTPVYYSDGYGYRSDGYYREHRPHHWGPPRYAYQPPPPPPRHWHRHGYWDHGGWYYER